MTVLVVDIGGTHIKCKTPRRRDPLKFDSGRHMMPSAMIDQILDGTEDWVFDRVSLGFPGVVVHDRALTEPFNLGRGWVGFDYGGAFGKPVRILNDAAMQALGSYKGKRMLFLGLARAWARPWLQTVWCSLWNWPTCRGKASGLMRTFLEKPA